jgi:O-antigen/teichoic acid export membrane protein
MSGPSATSRALRLKMISDALVLTGGTYLSRLLRLAAGFVRAKYLGPGLFGTWNGLMVVADYSIHTTLGIGRAASRELPRNLGSDDEEGYARVQQTVFTVFFIQGAIYCVGLLILGAVLWPFAGPVVAVGLMTVGGLICLMRLMEILDILLTVHLKFAALSLGLMLLWGSHLGLMFVLVPRWGMYGFYGVVIWSYFLLVVFWLLISRRIFPRRFRFDWREIKRLTKIGFPFHIGVGLAGIMDSVDRIMAITFLGAAALGLYGLGLMITTAMMQVPLVIETVLHPRMYRRFGEERTVETFRPFFFMPLMVLSLLIPALLIVVAVAAPPLVGRFLPQFVAALPVLEILLFVALFGSLGVPPYGLLFGLDRQRLIMVINGLSIPFAVGINGLFLWFGWGLIGLALGTAVTNFLVASVMIWSGLVYYAGSVPARLWQLGRVFLPGLVMMGTMVVLSQVWPSPARRLWEGAGLPIFEGVWSPTLMGFWPALWDLVVRGLAAFGAGAVVWLAVFWRSWEMREVTNLFRSRVSPVSPGERTA